MRSVAWVLLAIVILVVTGASFLASRDDAPEDRDATAARTPPPRATEPDRAEPVSVSAERTAVDAGSAALSTESHVASSVPPDRASWLFGRVFDVASNEPIDGARVIVLGVVGEPVAANAVSDARGAFRTSAFVRANPTERIAVVAPGTIPQLFDSVPIVLGANEHDFGVDRGETLIARVLDVETLAPVAGATIRAEVFPEEVEVAITGEDGRARVRGVTRDDVAITLSARKPGHFGTRRFLESPSSHAGAEIEFRVGRECRIEATALDAAGSPVGGSLLLELTTLFSTRQLMTALPISLPEGLELEYRWTNSRILDDTGIAVISELPPLPIARVWLQIDERIRRAVSVEPFTACGQTRRVDFRAAQVRDPATIIGRLTMNGLPTKAKVFWEVEGGRSDAALVADEHGEYRLVDVPPGLVTLSMTAETTGESRVMTIGIGVGQTVRVDFDFLRDGSRISGRVIDVSGNPIAGVEVTAMPERMRSDAARLVTMSDARGAFAFVGLEDGSRFVIEARSAGYRVTVVEGDSGRVDIVIRLEADTR